MDFPLEKARYLMNLALKEAGLGAKKGEVPIGAVLWDLKHHQILAKAHNQSIALNDPSAHAEILALRQAGEKINNYRLLNSVMVVTLEPCIMCLGALVQARVSGLIFGARDPKAGAIYSRLDYPSLKWLNHKFWVIEGVLSQEAGGLLKAFFLRKRKGEVPKWS